MNGAGGETRTLTLFPKLDFESSASTSSATPALGGEVQRGAQYSYPDSGWPVLIIDSWQKIEPVLFMSYRLALFADQNFLEVVRHSRFKSLIVNEKGVVPLIRRQFSQLRFYPRFRESRRQFGLLM